MAKPTNGIALLRGISEPEARSFCEEVQRYSQGSVPSYKAIADIVRKSPSASLAEVAAEIGRQRGVAVRVSNMSSLSED